MLDDMLSILDELGKGWVPRKKEDEIYHHLSERNRKYLKDNWERIQVKTFYEVDRILTLTSDVVRNSDGLFIDQGKKGTVCYKISTHMSIRIKPEYVGRVFEYLRKNYNSVSHGAKLAFESEDEEAIAKLLKQGKRTKQEKKGNNAKNMQQNTNTPGKWFT